MSVIMWQYIVHERPVFGREKKTRILFSHHEPMLMNSFYRDAYEPVAVWRVKRFATLKKWYKIIKNICNCKSLKNKKQ